MKKSFFLAMALVIACAASSSAAEPIQADISNSSLSELGLGEMTVVSDDEGAKVRGMGFSLTSGLGFALGLNPFAGFSTNNYNSGGLFTSGGTNRSTAGFGFGSGFGLTPGFGFGGGIGAGQFGSGGSGSFGF
jgi:opacity protein-like surface antigen